MFRNDMIRDIFKYRNYIVSAIKIEFYSKYKRSKLGILWMIIHPFMQVLIYTLVLSAILKAKLSGIDSQYAYAIYLMSGIAGWTLFSDISSRLLTVFIDNGNLLKKVKFPRIILPMIIVGVAFVNFLIMFISMFIVFFVLGHVSTEYLFWMPIIIFVTLINAIGIGLFLGVLNIFIRDVGQIMTIALQFWFWLTPIVYSMDMLPESYQYIFTLNPMTGIIMSYQSVLAYNTSPNIELLVYPGIVGMAIFFLAIFMYNKANQEMADVL
jgi:lipopolysaccharide transport system permease protein